VSYAGNRYCVIRGQEVGASTNAPSGTTADNAWWYYMTPGGVGTTYPAWVSGTTYRAGGAYNSEGGGNAGCVFVGGYCEFDQPFAQFTSPTLVTGKSMTPWTKGVAVLTGAPNGIHVTGDGQFDGVLAARGRDHALGVITGVSDSSLNLNQTNSRFDINSIRWAAGVPMTVGNLSFIYGFGIQLDVANPTWAIRLRNNGTNIALVTSAGLDLQSGKVLSNNGTTLIDGSGVIQAAATPAFTGDVTKPAGSLAQTIANAAVTYAKIQNVAAASLFGNPTGAAAAGSEISLAGGLVFSGTTLSAAGALTPTSVASTGNIITSGGSLGYAAGAGGAITQATSKSTGVTLNKVCGKITMNAAALAAAAIVEFTVTNSQVANSDTVNLNLASGATTSTAYRYWISAVAAGSFKVCVENRSAGSLSEALVLNFAVIKAVTA
jgi:hypothetical protein